MSVVLLYHRVAVVPHDPFGQAVHPDRFTAQVEHLRRSGRVIPLSDVLRPGSKGGIALTFDDGYADNAMLAAPLLADAGLPATWFVTVDTLGRRRFWWDRLAEALLGPHGLPSSADVEVAGRRLWLDLRTPSARTTALHFLWGRLLDLPPAELDAEVERLLGHLDAPPPTQEDLTMTVDQLRVLAELPLQEVGAHTRTHARLATQSEEVQRDEILESVRLLTDILHRPVVDFAYPFGDRNRDVGPLAPRLVEEAGCRLACTTDPRPVSRRSHPYRLPRVYVGDWEVDRFAAMLEGVLP
ncbi:polysaccharide deacetylase family protein [Geodermatophilus sp. SYSU D00867]